MNKILNRQNAIGLEFTLIYLTDTNTRISLGNKSIIVQSNIETLNQNWFNWMMKGQKIQYAFPELNPSEREFIMTGIIPEEWNEMFPSKE